MENYTEIRTEENKIPVTDRILITPKDAADLLDVGITCVRKMMKKDDCNFVVKVGLKKMIHREKFTEYMREQTQL